MATDSTNVPNPPASGATQAAATPPTADDAFPNPFAAPFQSSPGDEAAPTAAGDSNLPDPFASDPFQSSPSSNDPTQSTGSAGDAQTGIWVNDPDPQFLIQWSLQPAQAPQPAAPNTSQSAPPGTYQARVRIFQEIFETTLTAARPIVPFSLRDAVTASPYLQGSLILLQQPSGPPPVLSVKNLRFSGFQQSQVVLFPSTPDFSGELTGATSGSGGSNNESGG